jgi:hypothetical protein
MNAGPRNADEMFGQLAGVIGAWRAYKATVDRQSYMFAMPRRVPTFEGFMDYLSVQLDRRDTHNPPEPLGLEDFGDSGVAEAGGCGDGAK